MVSLTLKVILHVTENDSTYRDVAPLRLTDTKDAFHFSELAGRTVRRLVHANCGIKITETTEEARELGSMTRFHWFDFTAGTMFQNSTRCGIKNRGHFVPS